MDILITDLTVMREGGNYCIAGWDSQNARMLRPLPDLSYPLILSLSNKINEL